MPSDNIAVKHANTLTFRHIINILWRWQEVCLIESVFQKTQKNKKGEQYMNFNNFTIKSQEAVQQAVNLVQSRGQQAIEPEHLLAGVLKVGENVTNFIFQKLGVNGQQIETVLDKQIASMTQVSGGEPYLSRDAN